MASVATAFFSRSVSVVNLPATSKAFTLALTSDSSIAIPNALTLSLSPSKAFVNAALAPSAPPLKFVNDARSTANSLTSVLNFNAALPVNPNPVNKSPVSLNNCFAFNELNPKFLDKLAAIFSASSLTS